LKDGGIVVGDVALRRPTLDDVFLAVTGHPAEPAPEQAPDRRNGSKKRKGRR
jgi:hypothetical protein